MAATGIARIADLLVDTAGTKPLARGDYDFAAVGVLQDLLVGHGAHLPSLGDAGRGTVMPSDAIAFS